MGATPKKISGFVYNVDDIEFTRDSKGFYARDNSGRSIKYSDLTSAKEVITTKQKITDIALSPDGTRIAGTSSNGVLYTWDVKNNFAAKEVFKNPSGAELTTLAYAPDNRRIVIGDNDGLVRIVTEDASITRILLGHQAHIEQIRFNHAGNFLATTSRDKSVRLWNWDKLNEQPIVLEDHADWVWSATFSPDDEQLLVGINSSNNSGINAKANETIHAWPTKIETMSGLLCNYVKRNITKEEWDTYVDATLKYEKTCDNYPANNK